MNEALALPLVALRVAALVALVVAAPDRQWPARMDGLRRSLRIAALWVVFVWASAEIAPVAGGILSALLSITGVALAVATAAAHGRDGAVAGFGWLGLGFHAVAVHWILLGPVEDWRALNDEGGAPKLTLAEFTASGADAASLTDAWCTPEAQVHWTTKRSGKSATTTYHDAYGLVSPGWRGGEPVTVWVDAREPCRREARRVERVVRDRRPSDAMRRAVPPGVRMPPDAVLVRELAGDADLVWLAQVGAWLHVVLAAVVLGWAMVCIPMFTRPGGWAEPWPVRARWAHDRVVFDLGPVRAPRLRIVEPVATGLFISAGLAAAGPVGLCAIGLIGESTGLYGIQVPTVLAVFYGVVVPGVALGSAIASARRGAARQELVVGRREIELAGVRGDSREVVWEVPTYHIVSCIARSERGQLRGLVFRREGSGPLYVSFPDAIAPGLDLAALVEATAQAARDGHGESWEVPAALLALMDRPPD
ncbi:MAG: hypothetical protein ACI8PZ_007308 [Myxococcota bacterium]|jgi:hypothetical protein